MVGWIFYGLAVAQYLIIGLLTEGDRLRGLLREFDRSAKAIREELLVTEGGAASHPDDKPTNTPADVRSEK
jgi:hypothetical protein